MAVTTTKAEIVGALSGISWLLMDLAWLRQSHQLALSAGLVALLLALWALILSKAAGEGLMDTTPPVLWLIMNLLW